MALAVSARESHTPGAWTRPFCQRQAGFAGRGFHIQCCAVQFEAQSPWPLGDPTRLWGHPCDPPHREVCGTIDACAVARRESRGSAVPDRSRRMNGREHWDPGLAARAACGSRPGRTSRLRNIRWPHHPRGHQDTAVCMRHTEEAPVAPCSCRMGTLLRCRYGNPETAHT